MPKKVEPTELLNIFLVKADISEPKAILKGFEALDPYDVPLGGKLKGTLYIQRSIVRIPKWARIFEGLINPKAVGLRTASSAAVLLTKLGKRTLAVAFGHGRHLLQPGAVEEHFGLHATLNAIDRERVRVIDRKRFDAIARQTREQASREVPIINFGLDMEQDLIRSLSGPPSDQSLGRRVSGRDSLAVSVPTSLPGLRFLLDKYLRLGLDDAYKEYFPEVGNIVEIERRDRQAHLNDLLVERIRAEEADRIWLAVPDILDWTDIHFSYSMSSGAPKYGDIRLASYLEYAGGASDVDLSALKRHHVYCTSASTDSLVRSWPVFRCIYAEVDTGDGTYLLDDGHWFKVDQGLVATVNAAVASIAPSSLALLPYRQGEREDQYNKRLADSNPSLLALLDKQSIVYGGGKSQIEFCDVYSADKVMVHVKRYGGSSVLSHLFAQGVSSATLLVGDATFRAALNQRLPKAYRLTNPAQRPIASEFEVAFAIASISPTELVLPFFSRVTLRNAHRQLTNLGFRTTCTRVPVVESGGAA